MRPVFVGPHCSSEQERLTISQLPRLAKAAVKERHKMTEVIVFDENPMLLSRRKLCRENPMSARGMK